jgi:hypothetical protein
VPPALEKRIFFLSVKAFEFPLQGLSQIGIVIFSKVFDSGCQALNRIEAYDPNYYQNQMDEQKSRQGTMPAYTG